MAFVPVILADTLMKYLSLVALFSFTGAVEVDEDIVSSIASLFEDPDEIGVISQLLPWTHETATPTWYEVGYRSSLFDSSDMGTQTLLYNQRNLDFQLKRSVPLLNYDVELINDASGDLEPIRLGARLARQYESILYLEADNPNIVLKYQVNCKSLGDDFHPITRDYFFLKFLESTNTVPKVYTMSPGVKFDNSPRTKKTDFMIQGDERRNCARDDRSHVRYMVMDRVSDTVWDAATRTRLTLRAAAVAIRGIIRNLSIIHGKGVVHGDVHAGNLAMLSPQVKRLVFIDFGSAFFADTYKNDPPIERERLSYVHILHSPWELEGYRSTSRDDLFRAVMVGAVVLHGEEFVKYLQSLPADGGEMLRYKKEQFIFHIPGVPDRFETYPFKTEEDRAEVRQRFQRVLDIARDAPDLDVLGPYAEIIAELEIAIAIMTKK